MPGEWYISGVDAKSYPLEDMKTNRGGSIAVRAIPLNALEPLERIDEKEEDGESQSQGPSVERIQQIHKDKGLSEIHRRPRTRAVCNLQTSLSLF